MLYIGDVSKNDYLVLKEYAKQAENILEFGCGASTQILAKYGQDKFTSVETDPGWIERTKNNLKLLEITNPVNFEDYYTFKPSSEYDLIFDDGATEFRLPFAILTWKHLRIGGSLLIHDTRTDREVKVIAELIKEFSPEIEGVFMNMNNSNITAIKKKKAEFYENWNVVENRKPWQSGYEEINMEEFNELNKK